MTRLSLTKRHWRYLSWFILGGVLAIVLALIQFGWFSTGEPPFKVPAETSSRSQLMQAEGDQATSPTAKAQTTLHHAQGFSIRYHSAYKEVTVHTPWQNARQPLTYILVPRGQSRPKNLPANVVIVHTPVQRMVSLSTTYLPALEKLEQVETLVGVDEIKRVTMASVQQRFKAGKVTSLGEGPALSLERLLALEPDLVMTFGVDGSSATGHDRLLRAGIPVVINAEHLETTPLGRAEWLKFVALFYDREAAAEKIFSQIEQRYQAIARLAQSADDRPTVFTGLNLDGTWYMPGGQSYAAAYLRDAAANFLWADNTETGSLPLSIEAVLERAADADIWLNGRQSWMSRADILAEDPRYNNFRALRTGQVYNNNARLNAAGGNDYWESGLVNPDVILADLVKIFHPDLLPQHQLVYYRKIDAPSS